MTTSGTNAFSLDIVEIIEEAFELAGSVSRSGYDMKTAKRSLDLLMREWDNRGINFWTIEEDTASVTSGTASVTLDTDAIDIIDAAWRTGSGTSQQDRAMTRISVHEWSNLASKNQTGLPSLYWVNRVTGAPVVYLWPVPESDGTFLHYKIRAVEDTGTYTNTMDVPSRFIPAMTAGLALRLAMKMPDSIDRVPMLAEEYERQFRMAAEEDRERASLWLVPDLG